MNDSTLKSFLAACGSNEPLRLGVGQRDELQSENWTFQQPFLVIGRHSEMDLVLDHWQVSRRHAYVQLIEGRYYCVDLGSRTGTHGGDTTERSGWLERGRAIQIGPFAVRPEWPPASARAPESLPGVTWELPGRAVGQAVWRMDRHLVLVGRSAACKIRIVEADVSKFHCSLVLTAQGVWVVDLLGQKGVFVNDEPVRCARLDDNDEVRIGRHLLRVRYDVPPPPLPLPGPPLRLELPPPSDPADGIATIEPPAALRFPFPGADLPARLFPQPPQPNRELATMLEQSGTAIEPSVNLLVQQFGAMQQQMFDQFHHTMLMMFEGFAALHREQAGSIREEFEQVRKLSAEIEALREETAKAAQAAQAAAQRPPDRPRFPTTNGHPPTPRPAPLGPPIKRAEMPLPEPGVDIHAQLCQKLASIESERQNRWQKILAMMTSKS